MLAGSSNRYKCPACEQELPHPGWRVHVRCEACLAESRLPRPAPLRGFLPIVLAWGLAPALLFTASGFLAPPTGEAIGVLGLLATPPLAYSWSCFILHRARVRLYGVFALFLGLLVVVLNVGLGVSGCLFVANEW